MTTETQKVFLYVHFRESKIRLYEYHMGKRTHHNAIDCQKTEQALDQAYA